MIDVRRAALYLRSSKDRSDISIATQRQQLAHLAAERGFTIVDEFADVVESAKSEYRPAFQQLIAALRQPGRSWSAILMIDHSRLSREPYVGHVFRYECAKFDVEVIFGAFPELDPISRIILDSVMDAMAVVHSIMSKQKGLAGMAENVRRGWRAGGRAPRGYRLARIPTGAVREGAPVLKSVLEPGPEAPMIARYLQARAAGISRARLVRELDLTLSGGSLVALEWNALTYAGHTVWNRHNALRAQGGYLGSRKMRDRADWHITRDTHPALITEAEALAILATLETSEPGRAVAAARRGISPHLLTSVLVAPDGRRWEGWRDRYRVKGGNGLAGRYVHKLPVETAVVEKMQEDFSAGEFIEALVREARHATEPSGLARASARQHQADLVALNSQIARATELTLAMTDPAPMLRQIETLEGRRRELAAEIARQERERGLRAALQTVTPDHLRGLIAGMAQELAAGDDRRVRGVLQSAVEAVSLDPVTLDCRIRYRIPLERTLSLASPRGSAGWGILRAESVVLGLIGKVA